MKKIVSIMLCLFMLFTLGACKKDSSGATSTVIEYEYITQSGDNANGDVSDKNDSDKDSDDKNDSDKDSDDKNDSDKDSDGKNDSDKDSDGKNDSDKDSDDKNDSDKDSDDKNDSDKDSDDKNNTTVSTDSSGKKVTVTNNCYSSGRKIAKDKITFKVLIRDHTGGITNYNNCALTKWIESNLNIKLQFTTCTQDEINTKLTLAYASKTNPYDIYMGVVPTGVHGSYIKQGKVQKLDKLIDTYGTNIKKMFKEYPQLEYLSTFDDGSFYSLPRIYDSENFSDLLYINTDWLKAVGKSLPTTTDEFKAVLKAFKSKYPGKTPFASNTDAGANIGPSLLGPFGISTYHNWFYIDQSNDTIKYALSSDKYRNALRYYNDLYASGLMQLIPTKDTILNMTTTDSVGCFSTDDWTKCVTPENLNKSWTIVPVLNAKSGGTWANVVFENAHADVFLVTDACKYPEAAVRLADWFYSLEGSLSAKYGPVGEYWEWTSGNKIKFNKNKIPSNKTETEYLYGLSPYYCFPRYMGTEYFKTTSSATVSAKTETDKANAKVGNLRATLIRPNAQVKYKYPQLAYTTAETKTKSDAGSYNQYTQGMRRDFITGAKNINNDWDSYIATLKSTYRITEVEKVENTAYKRYKAWLSTHK